MNSIYFLIGAAVIYCAARIINSWCHQKHLGNLKQTANARLHSAYKDTLCEKLSRHSDG